MSKRKQIDTVAAAREVARAEVARHWPELAAVEPTVTRRERLVGATRPDRVGAGAAGPAPAARQPGVPAAAEYTFTFTSHIHTADGYLMPRVARVTVDAEQRVVKATTSK
jgi:hypothetical protein